MNKFIAIFLLALLTLSCQENQPAASGDQIEKKDAFITLYTHRHYDTDKVVFKTFEEETGVEVRVVKASADELIQKMESEGEQSPADLLISVDAGRLVRAKAKGLLQPVTSSVLEKNIPGYLKDSENNWFGITKRARIIAYDKNKVNPADLSTYEALTAPEWNKKVLIRSSGNIYNQSLLASIIAHHGEAKAGEWAAAMVKNMARSPRGNDRDQVKAILAGEGEVAVINTYYLGKLLNSKDPEEVKAGEAVQIFFPNQDGRGTHINVSGIGVAAHAPNKADAVRFIEYLSRKDVQETFAGTNYEYPVNPAASPSELLISWGEFKEDELPLPKLGELNKKAVITFDEAGWK